MRSSVISAFLLASCSALGFGCSDPPPSSESEAGSGGSTSGGSTSTTTDAGTTTDTTAALDTSTTVDPTTTDPTSTTDPTTTDASTTDDDPDEDDDGYPASVDCDDTDPEVHPGAPERCNGVDDDCDPTTPEDGVVSVDGQGSWPSISAAIAAAAPGSEVRVCAGTYAETLILDQDLWLVAQEGAAATIIDAEGLGTTVRVLAGEITLNGFTLTGGSSVGFGGGLGITGTELVTVEECVVTGNDSSDGAGIYTSVGAQLAVVQTTIVGNTGEIGGGMAMNGDGLTGSLTMTDCTIADNVADEAGGGLVIFDVPQVQITSTAIIDNLGLDGGGLTVAGSMVTLSEATVQRNVATGSGGGLLLYSGSGVVVSADSDWGTGPDDNVLHDVAIPGVGVFTGYGAAASFQCNALGCG